MISAFVKKFVSTEENADEHGLARSKRQQMSNSVANCAFPVGVNPIGAELRRKFASGIDYNMKILIRGDRNTGKTSLWRRLQGMPFLLEEEGDSYTQTDEIQVAAITWDYRARDFVVKVDIWDVVDKGRRTAGVTAPLKLGIARKNDVSQSVKGSAVTDIPSAVQEIQNAACDACTVNVYNGCDGVVMLFDVTRDWTWDYIRRELPSVPAHIPTLVMANKMDLVSSTDQQTPSSIHECLQFLRAFNERCKPGPNSSSSRDHSLPLPIRFAKASMKRAQGLKFLYNFLNIPFLRVQQSLLKNAMEANLREFQIAEDELDTLAQQEEGPILTTWRKKSVHLTAGVEKVKMGDDEEEEEEEEEREDVEPKAEEERGGGGQGKGRQQGQQEGTGQGKLQRNSARTSPGFGGTRPPRLASFSSSSEDANPHVSTYAEDFDDAQNDQSKW